jgi:N-acetylmuramoyl-L-alanine amidase
MEGARLRRLKSILATHRSAPAAPIRFSRRAWPCVAALVALGAFLSAARPAAAQSGTPDVLLTSVRSWTAPSNTRIVFDFSLPVTPAMPDSGESSELVVGIPGEPIALGPGVPRSLRVEDGVVDSVTVGTGPSGASFRLFFHDTTRFAAFALQPEDDKPYRIVVDVTRKGAAAAEEQRLASLATTKKRERSRLVVIDAGHGGEDPGARGPNGVREKNVTLAVAKALAAELDQIPGVKTLLTRSGDWFIPLRERYRIAEKAKADVFISIHCNSSRRRGAGSGSEVFFLSLRGASDQADSDLADLENAADLLGGVPQNAEDDLVNILYDVKRNSALQKSQLLAEALLDEISGKRLEARGVKQAGFVVLKSVEFPSVLVETAFINNPREAKMLRDPVFQKAMAKQLATGVKNYFQRAGIGVKADSLPAGAPGGAPGGVGGNAGAGR